MPVDFTVIQPVRQRFGDQEHEEVEAELEAPFVGYAKVFPFSCPNVAPSEFAVLQFESYGVTTRNILMINDVAVPGGITPGASRQFFVTPGEKTAGGFTTPFSFWKAHSLLVPENVLAQENTLYIESIDTYSGSRDNFIIDNVVIFFKTGARPGQTLGGVGEIGEIGSR